MNVLKQRSKAWAGVGQQVAGQYPAPPLSKLRQSTKLIRSLRLL